MTRPSSAGPSSQKAKKPNASVRRDQVPAACHICRARKVKCDGMRPCGQCNKRGLDCQYSTNQNETQRQADARQSAAAARDMRILQSLFERIASEPDEAKALDLFTLIRRGRSPASIVRHTEGLITDRTLSHIDEPQLAFLLRLVQSTASLGDVATLASQAFLADQSFTLPSIGQYDQLRGRMVTLSEISRMINHANGRLAIADVTNPEVEPQPPTITHHGCVTPWTTMLDTDEEMSQFLSVFFSFLNPLYRFLETDIFLGAMKGGDVNSKYCSPLLVHAILATTSLFCEFEKAFTSPGQYFSRGEHFLQEALQLWAAQDEKPSIVNVQAAMLISYTMALLGQGKQSIQYLIKAGQLDSRLEALGPSSSVVDQRALISVHQAVAYWDLLMRSMYRMPTEIVKPLFYQLRTTLSKYEDVVHWRPYPCSNDNYPYRTNILAAAREEIMCFMYEINQIVTEQDHDLLDYSNRITSTIARFRTWYIHLDPSLQYQGAMSSGLFELHALYMTFQLVLYSAFDESSLASDLIPPGTSSRMTKEGDLLAREAARLVKDYQRCFGYKVIIGLLVPMSQLSSFRLLRELQQSSSQQTVSANKPGSASSATEAAEALEECFRCLLAISMQQALPMRIAQAVYNAALDLQAYLPENVLKMLSVLIKPKLQEMMNHKIDSLYPQYSLNIKPDIEGAASALLRMADEGH